MNSSALTPERQVNFFFFFFWLLFHHWILLQYIFYTQYFFNATKKIMMSLDEVKNETSNRKCLLELLKKIKSLSNKCVNRM